MSRTMMDFSVVGKSLPRIDALDKATGKAQFCTDIRLPNMLYAKVLGSPYPHARIIHIDTSKAERVPGVAYIATGKDAPDKKYGVVICDESMLAKKIVRATGVPVAAVAADSISAAEEAISLIDVQYEPMEAVFDPEEAMGTNPPVVIHPDLSTYEVGIPHYHQLDKDRPNVFTYFKIRKGDVEKGFNEADFVLENRFSTARVQHCAIENDTTVARVENDGGLTIWLNSQLVLARRADLSRLFDIELSKIRAIQPHIGGAFGCKATMRNEAIATLLSIKTGKPVKLELTREEVFQRGGARAPVIIYIKDGVTRDGTIVAREMKAIISSGGSGESAVAVVARNCAFAAIATYRLPNFKWDSCGVYVNEPTVNAFRGFGSTQITFAIESHMDMIANKIGVSPVDIRKRNLLEEGDINAIGEITHSMGTRQCLEEVLDAIKIENKSESKGVWCYGKGLSIGNKYSLAPSISNATIKLSENGDVIVYHGASEIGQGCNMVMAQIAAEEFGISVADVKIAESDTIHMPNDSGTIGSRVTYHTGNAVRLACLDVKKQLFEIAGQRLGVSPGDLEIGEKVVYVKGSRDKVLSIPELFRDSGTGNNAPVKLHEIIGKATFIQDSAPEDIETGQIDPQLAKNGKRHNAFYSHTAKAVEVAVNTATGEVKVLKCVVADDMGQPINPKMCEQQQDGGMAMGIGAAIYEEVKLKEGAVTNANLTDYRMVSTEQMPTIDHMKTIIAGAPHKDGPNGAKGIGEVAIIGLDAAIANAVYNAVGVRIKDLPVSAERLLKALMEKNC